MRKKANERYRLDFIDFTGKPSMVTPLRLAVLAVLMSLAHTFVMPGSAAAASPPQWKLTVTPDADYFIPGPSDASATYMVEAENVGELSTVGEVTLKDNLPVGLTPTELEFYYIATGAAKGSPEDTVSGQDLLETSPSFCPSKVECKFPGLLSNIGVSRLRPHQRLIMIIGVGVEAGLSGPLTDSFEVSGGGAATAVESATNQATNDPVFGIRSFTAPPTGSSTNPYAQAGGHPYQLVTEWNFKTETMLNNRHVGSGPKGAQNSPVLDPKEVSTELAPGLIGNPGAVPRCDLADFIAKQCPLSTAVGMVGVRYEGQTQGGLRELGPLYNLTPAGEFPGMLGFEGAFPYILTASLRSGTDYGIDITNLSTPEAAVNRIRATTWGVPAEPVHDELRGKTCLSGGGAHVGLSVETYEKECEERPGLTGGGGPAEVEETPFLTMPTACTGEALVTSTSVNSWQVPSEYAADIYSQEPVDGCSSLAHLFEPEIEARPTTSLADAPSGLEFDLTVPQHEEPAGLSSPALREAVVRLPAGLSLNPSSANGLAGCSEAQLGFLNAAEREAPQHCPDASKIGTAELKTSLLREPLGGALYLATPHQNPSHSLLAGYLVFEGQGLHIKLAGRFEADSSTGQITARFLENPPLPFEELKLKLFSGARGALRTPATCGTYTTTSVMTPYSAPESGPSVEPSAEFETTGAPHSGEDCQGSATSLPNAPVFRAGTESAQAGSFTPFSFRLAREDGSQELSKVETTLPPGLVGKLAGIEECPEGAIAQAQSREHEGGGAEEIASPSCPSSSEVGTVEVAAGAGPTPYYTKGRAYLAGPYNGAPLSLAIITPAVAGPFDLGDVLVRTALYVNPATAQIRAVSDQIPHILDGIPLDVRSITLKMSRNEFTLNPTNCNELGFTGSETSVFGQSSPLVQRFQVGGCRALGFSPRLSLSLKGQTRPGGHPALRAVLRMPRPGVHRFRCRRHGRLRRCRRRVPRQANIARASVILPHSEFLDQGHLQNICTRVQFAVRKCPRASIYGHAKAWSPLLARPLSGPVYLRSSSHKLPDLVAALRGQIEVDLDGRVDSVKGGIGNVFEVVPDAPVSKFVLSMRGGSKGLLVNSTNICAGTHRALARFTAHNGKLSITEPALRAKCPKARRRHGRHRHRPGRGG